MGSSRGAAGGQSWTAELPWAAREFLEAAGVEWEPLNEGGLRAFARYVREYADGQEEVLRAGLRVMAGLEGHYEGPVYEALLAEYREGAEGRLAGMVDGTRACADRLDAAAEVIAVMQSEVVEELVALAADPTRPPERRAAAARRHVDHLEEHLLHYVLDQVNEVAVARLTEALEGADAPGGPASAALLAALDRGGDAAVPGHRVVSSERVERAAEAMRHLRGRAELLVEVLHARMRTVDLRTPPGPDDALHREFLVDRGTVAALFGAEGAVTLAEPELLARIAHRPTRVFLRDVGLPDDTVFFGLSQEYCDGEAEIGDREWAPYAGPFDPAHWLCVGGFGDDSFHLDTATGAVYCIPGEGEAHPVASSPDRFVLALSALEAERPLYDPERSRSEHLDPEGVEERFLALLHRVDPGPPPGPGSYWTRVLEYVHQGLNCY
ncbi:SUKH-4 family immunity protein [Kitasatospora sp. NPDC057198]|uniref:SUKH-4 family immunity protein n=1 Tax=Kitasatospora sp. NPDC057198 TaxID=3346046 RepID=UPI00363CD4B2